MPGSAAFLPTGNTESVSGYGRTQPDTFAANAAFTDIVANSVLAVAIVAISIHALSVLAVAVLAIPND
ncbi:MAG: hypothetical protein OXH68_19250 [Gammaproteobacteria bacterium]|nr:hypothetical protein [Gammaproteobacteria bacterium]